MAPAASARRDQLGPLLHRRRDGLLHQHVDATAQQRGRDLQVGGRRHHHAHRIHGIRQGGGIREDDAPRLGGNLRGPLWIGIHHPHQLHIGHPGVDQGMEAPEIPNTDDTHPHLVRHRLATSQPERLRGAPNGDPRARERAMSAATRPHQTAARKIPKCRAAGRQETAAVSRTGPSAVTASTRGTRGRMEVPGLAELWRTGDQPPERGPEGACLAIGTALAP